MKQSTGGRLKRLTGDAMLLCAAMILSYLEAILPLSLAVPLPGVKLGLANLAVMVAFFRFGAADAAAVSAARVLLCGLLFGSPVSLALAASGAFFAFCGLLIYRFALRRALSYVGASLLSAALHVVGQLAAASVVVLDASVFAYAPVMLCAGVVTGTVNGIICPLILNKLNGVTVNENA